MVLQSEHAIASRRADGIDLIDESGEPIAIEQVTHQVSADAVKRELAKAQAANSIKARGGRPKKATIANAKPRSEVGPPSVDDLVEERLNAKLRELGLMPEADPEPTEEPTETGEFQGRLYLKGRGDLVRQITVFHQNSRTPYRFQDGVIYLSGPNGEEVYHYLLENDPKEVFTGDWDYERGAAPACNQCGYRVPNLRAYQAHLEEHQVMDVRSR